MLKALREAPVNLTGKAASESVALINAPRILLCVYDPVAKPVTEHSASIHR